MGKRKIVKLNIVIQHCCPGQDTQSSDQSIMFCDQRQGYLFYSVTEKPVNNKTIEQKPDPVSPYIQLAHIGFEHKAPQEFPGKICTHSNNRDLDKLFFYDISD